MEIHQDAWAQAYPPASQQCLESRLGIGISQQQQMAALFNIRVNAILFLFHDGTTWAGEDQHGRIVRHGRFLQERDRSNVIALTNQGLFRNEQTIPVFILDVQLTVAFNEDDPFFRVLGDPDQCAGQFDFRGGRHADRLPVALEDGRVGPKDAVRLGHLWLLFRIDEFHAQLGRGLPITLQALFEGLIARVLFSGEDRDLDVSREGPKHSVGLGCKGIVLVLREIPPDRMSCCQKVHDHQNAREEYDHQKAVEPHLR